MIDWTQKNIEKIYNLYDKYSDVLAQRYGYRTPEAKYSFLLDCQKEAAEQYRLSIDGYIDELTVRFEDSEEFKRIKAECEKPHLEYYMEAEPLRTIKGCVYHYKPVDKYVELAKVRVAKILGDLDNE